jgi:hypothetical protein
LPTIYTLNKLTEALMAKDATLTVQEATARVLREKKMKQI